ncbi:MAG: chorismate--pyruvate lyase family protein [bacterium]
MPSFSPAAVFLEKYKPSAKVLDWLMYEDSLTSRLREKFTKPVEVELIFQGEQLPKLDEQQLLSLKAGEKALVREVRLFAGCQTCLMARTIIPKLTLEGDASELARLGNRPLGHVIFSDPGLKRDSIEFGYEKNGKHENWSRRTIYNYLGKPLLVAEVFDQDFEF